ncbi:MAG: bifunctional 4-hydroxy-2-oxoglutarate aldolase/2-dehydro-3-deoxy-phosphogluconate aldolase [Candidatus Omnitrophica bacterium]|nr:bifunctional 4-hydroxy-2-oxoglutarate aldolase/2-dehydro-3-deoxy-phosphogluconate aldolase [Candidatus Omnitrophota bacterium]
MTNQIELTSQRIKQAGIVAILRGDYSLEAICQIADALLAAELSVIEVTLNTKGALEAIAHLRAKLGDRMLIAAGTVRTSTLFDQAVQAGAHFTVAPNFDPATAARAQAKQVLHLPGVFTPTEAQTAFASGCRMLKLYPSEFNGPAYLKTLRAPLDDIDFVPTGGVSLSNIALYAQVGAAAVGIGGSLIPKAGWSPDEITAKARALRAVWLGARS